MTFSVQQPGGGPDVTRRNRRQFLYIKGDNDTNGSVRFHFEDGDSSAHIEERENDTWNDTSLRFGSSSILLGRNLILSAIAGFLETNDLSATLGHENAFIPHTDVAANGTTQFTFAPRMDVAKLFPVFIGAVSEISGTVIGINLDVSIPRAVIFDIHEVGTVGATSDVVVRFFKGTDNTGTLFNERTLPPSALLANDTLVIDYDMDLGFGDGQPVFQEFSSATPFSLKTDIGGNPLTGHFAHELRHLQIITENLMLDEDLNIVFDEELNPMYAIQFP